jgi:preprotein translocase subunit YajC
MIVHSMDVLAMQMGGGQGNMALGILPLVLIFGVFYFLLILPQQRRQKKWQKMLGELKTGDKVITSGGIRGTVIALREDFLHLRVPPDNIRIEISRSAVVQVASGSEEIKPA